MLCLLLQGRAWGRVAAAALPPHHCPCYQLVKMEIRMPQRGSLQRALLRLPVPCIPLMQQLLSPAVRIHWPTCHVSLSHFMKLPLMVAVGAVACRAPLLRGAPAYGLLRVLQQGSHNFVGLWVFGGMPLRHGGGAGHDASTLTPSPGEFSMPNSRVQRVWACAGLGVLAARFAGEVEGLLAGGKGGGGGGSSARGARKSPRIFGSPVRRLAGWRSWNWHASGRGDCGKWVYG